MSALSVTERRLSLKAADFAPIPVNGKAPTIMDWTSKIDVSDAEILSWGTEATNTGLIAKKTPALDIDVLNSDAAAAVEELVRQKFGVEPLVRVGLPPKRLIPFRTEQPFPKIVVNLIAPDGKTERLEFLGDGQHFVAFGTHPDTGQPYSWRGGEPGIVLRSALPHVDEGDAHVLINAAADLLVEQFGYRRRDVSTPRRTEPQDGAEHAVSIEEVKAALAAIDPDIDRDSWLSITGGLFKSFGDEKGFELWDEWSSRGSKYKAREMVGQWNSIARRDGYGWTIRTLFYHAYEADPGWCDALYADAEAKIEEANRNAPDIEAEVRARLSAASPEARDNDVATLSLEDAKPQTDADEQTKSRDPPPPEPSTAPADLWNKFTPPLLPRGVLPHVIEEFAFEKSKLMGADRGGIAMSALTVCAATIPSRVKIKVRRHDNWLESTRMWSGLVGGPGEKKSPSISQSMIHTKRREKEKYRKYLQKKKEWDALSKEERQGKEPPQRERVMFEDVTMEAVQEVLRYNPTNLLCHRDELSGWFGSMDKYGGRGGAAADRAFWLGAFDGGSFSYDRIGRGSHVIDDLTLSLIGGIQPEPMRKIANETVDDGLIQRINMVVMAPATRGIDAPISDAELAFERLLERLCWTNEPFDGYVTFDDAAAKVREDLEQRHLDLTQLTVLNKKLRSHIAKYDRMFARMCLLWHCIENVPNELPITVSESVARRVADFLHKFLLPHAMSFYFDVYGLADDNDTLIEVANYILAHNLTSVTGRTVQRGSGRMRGLKAREVEELFQQLENLGWVTRVQTRRVDMVHWQVNPEVHRLFRERAAREAERRARDRDMLQDIFAQGRP